MPSRPRSKVAPDDLLPKNERPIRVVKRDRRSVFEKVRANSAARLEIPENHGKRWTEQDIARILTADPDVDSYAAIAKELSRSDGAVRHVRIWAGHILRGEYEDKWRAWVESNDPRVRSHRHDVILIHDVLKKLGYLDLPVTQQFSLARPLDQPSGSWRGDRTSKALRARRQRTARALQTLLNLRQEETHGPTGRAHGEED